MRTFLLIEVSSHGCEKCLHVIDADDEHHASLIVDDRIVHKRNSVVKESEVIWDYVLASVPANIHILRWELREVQKITVRPESMKRM